MSTTNDNDQSAVLYVLGKDRQGMLERAATIANAHDVNIEECIGHTLADRAVMFMKLVGDDSGLTNVETDAHAQFAEDGLSVICSRTSEPAVPEDMAYLPWRIRISSRDFKGLLATITGFLARNGIRILSYNGEKYSPARAGGEYACVNTFTVRVPVDFDRRLFLEELEYLADEKQFRSAILEPL